MNLTDIGKCRLISQRIAGSKFKTAKEIVEWMGAMQAQDFGMAKWAIGVRLKDSTEKSIEDSFNKGEILRTHLLRPTWHLVTLGDISWLLELTAPRIKSAIKTRQKELELTPSILLKSNAIIEKALLQKKQLRREELVNEIKKAGITVDNNRASHLLLWAELEGLVCSGAQTENKSSYRLVEHLAPKKVPFSREEAISKLARRYFFSHSPATLHDFSWWSGLSVSEARHGLEMNKSDLVSETIGSLTYWFPDSISIPEKHENFTFLLPAYDEFIISYRNRDAVFSTDDQKKSISINGIFRPVIVIDGQVTGLWKRIANKNKVIVETELFRKHSKKEMVEIEKALEKLGVFLEKKVVLQNK